MHDVPGTWRRAQLGSVAEVVMGQSPPGHTYNKEGVGVPLINGPVEFGARHPTKIQWTTSPTKFCRAGDVLFCVRGSTTGRMNVSNDDYCIGRGVAAIRGLPGVASTRFLERYLSALAVEILEEAKGNGSTFPSINSSRLAASPVLLPTLPEQRRIAEILDTVDEAIRKTEEIIAKLKQVKQGLLHDLLTRGIDENGELRDPDRHPEQFKDSPLGRIPKAWGVIPLGQGIERSPQNGLYKPGTDYGDTGTPIVRIDGFYDGPIAPIASLKRVRLIDVERATYCLSPGDLLVNRVNSIDYVGKVGLVPTNLATTVVFESNMMRVVVDRGCVLPEFALHWLCSPQAKAHFHSRAKNAIAQASVNQTDIVDLPVVLPSLEEQRLIVQCVSEHGGRESVEEAQYRKLRLLKQGLMEDLLTGRVRVTSLIEEAAQ